MNQGALDGLRHVRRSLEQTEPPPSSSVSNRSSFELMTLEGRARKGLADGSPAHGDLLQAEALRRDAEIGRLLSQAGLLLDDLQSVEGAKAELVIGQPQEALEEAEA